MPNAITTMRTTTACLAMCDYGVDRALRSRLGNAVTTLSRDRLRILRSTRIPEHVLGVLLVLLADVLHQFFLRPESRREGESERFRIVARIDDRDLVLQRA